jgi:integrase
MRPDYTIQRLRGKWAVRFVDPATGKPRRIQLHTADRMGAEAEARQRLDAGQRGAWSVGRIITSYIEDREARGIVSTPRMHDAWKAMKPSWEGVTPRQIDEDMCRAYARQRDRSAATVRYELGMLATALSWAKKARHIDERPAIWLPQKPSRIVRHISRSEFARFLAEMKAPHARLYAVLGVTTAGRPSAILQLRWQQIDFARGLIRLNPEGRAQTVKGRATVPMTDRARVELEAAWKARQGPHVVEHGGKPLASIKKAFQAASERSGVKVTPYTLRHSAAVWLAESGVPMEEIAALMGHSDTRTTFANYAAFSPEYLRKASAALDW